MAFNLDLHIVVAGGDLLRAVGQLADRVREPAAEKYRQQQVQHQQNQRDRPKDRAQHLGNRRDLRELAETITPYCPSAESRPTHICIEEPIFTIWYSEPS